MKFGEKVMKARKELGITRQQLSEITGLSKRTIAYYELDDKIPKKRATYETLAEALHMQTECLIDENAEFVLQAAETYGAAGSMQAERLIREIRGLYAGGSLSEQDMDAMMLAIQDAYWIAKKKSAEKRKKSGSDDLV